MIKRYSYASWFKALLHDRTSIAPRVRRSFFLSSLGATLATASHCVTSTKWSWTLSSTYEDLQWSRSCALLFAPCHSPDHEISKPIRFFGILTRKTQTPRRWPKGQINLLAFGFKTQNPKNQLIGSSHGQTGNTPRWISKQHSFEIRLLPSAWICSFVNNPIFYTISLRVL